MYQIQFLKYGRKQMWPDICGRIQLELEMDSLMAAALLCMLRMCMKLHNLHINCSVLMLSLIHI